MLTIKRIMEWAGPRKFEEGRQLFEKGAVLQLDYEPPWVRGEIAYGTRNLRCQFVLLPDGSVESHCPCYDNRERGIICAHVVAMGLELHRRQHDPERMRLIEEERRRAARMAAHSPEAYVRRAAAGEAAVPATLALSLEPGWEAVARGGKAYVSCALVTETGAIPVGEAPRDRAYAFSAADENLLFVLEDIAQGPCPSRLEIGERDLAGLLRLMEGRAWMAVGPTPDVPVRRDRVPCRIQAAWSPTDGQIILSMEIELPTGPTAPERGVCVWDRKSGFYFDGSAFYPLATALPEPLRGLCAGPVRIPREGVPRFLQREWPALRTLCPVIGDVAYDQLRIEPAKPVFRLVLRGSPASLSATLHADYGVAILPAGKPDPAGWFAIPDPDDAWRYAVRDLERERAALGRLAAIGFRGEHGEALQPVIGCRAVANILARDLPALRRRGWKIEVQGRAADFLETARHLIPVIHVRPLGPRMSDPFELRVTFETPSGAAIPAADIQRAMLKGDSFLEQGEDRLLFDSGAVEAVRQLLEDCHGTPAAEPGAVRIAGMHAAYVQASLAALDGVDVEAPPDWRARLEMPPEPSADEILRLGSLDSVLRPYQREGVRWLRFLERGGFGGILADEMGLGKTLQTLAWLSLERLHPEARGLPALVICPTSLVENWAEEAARFTPHLRVCIMSGAERHDHWEAMARADLVITSYALLRRDWARYAEHRFSVVVLDEAQHIKNRSTQNAAAAKRLRALHRLVLTGTPMENSAGDLWSIMDFLMPDYLGSAEHFYRRYEVPISRGGEDGEEAQARLRRKLRPFLLRRLKRDVARELPPKIERIAWCSLTPDQARVYAQLLEQSRNRLREILAQDRLNGARMEVLTLLLRLRQACCHLDLLHLPDVHAQAPSCKMDLLFELLDEAVDGGHRVLVFSQFVALLTLVRRELDQRGWRYGYLDGQTRDRLQVVTTFNRSLDIPLCLVSLKAGGTGLNLTGADVVVHLDPWWNPAVEDQATDRAHRIGQQRSVYVVKLIARDTVEEKVLELQRRKQQLIQATIVSDEDVVSKMNWDDIRMLFDL